MTDLLTITQETIQSQIFTIRGKQVILDRDLAVLYGVETRVLNQAVKRNIERFPDDFMFELTEDEIIEMVSQNVIPSKQVLGGIFPRVFTEHGALMLSSVLRSDSAVKVSIKIMRAFVEVRKFLRDNGEVFEYTPRHAELVSASPLMYSRPAI